MRPRSIEIFRTANHRTQPPVSVGTRMCRSVRRHHLLPRRDLPVTAWACRRGVHPHKHTLPPGEPNGRPDGTSGSPQGLGKRKERQRACTTSSAGTATARCSVPSTTKPIVPSRPRKPLHSQNHAPQILSEASNPCGCYDTPGRSEPLRTPANPATNLSVGTGEAQRGSNPSPLQTTSGPTIDSVDPQCRLRP